jgi:hypothetical protein
MEPIFWIPVGGILLLAVVGVFYVYWRGEVVKRPDRREER